MRDEEFLRNKVPMTKSEVRAISIDKLDLSNKKSMLDVGAGNRKVFPVNYFVGKDVHG